MNRSGRLYEWFRFLDAHTGDEAVNALCNQMARLQDVYAEVAWVLRQLAGSPGGEVEEALRVARSALGEALELLDDVAMRLRAGERDAS
jgi:hypothetical protein